MTDPPSDRLSFTVESEPSIDDLEAVLDGLHAYNAQFIDQREELEHRPLAVFARDGDPLIGGANGHSAWGWLFLRHLWVDGAQRGTGLGTKLLGQFEASGIERHCMAVWLDTFSFQARPFYEKLGYRQFGELVDHPVGYRHHFLWKPLGARQEAS